MPHELQYRRRSQGVVIGRGRAGGGGGGGGGSAEQVRRLVGRCRVEQLGAEHQSDAAQARQRAGVESTPEAAAAAVEVHTRTRTRRQQRHADRGEQTLQLGGREVRLQHVLVGEGGELLLAPRVLEQRGRQLGGGELQVLPHVLAQRSKLGRADGGEVLRVLVRDRVLLGLAALARDRVLLLLHRPHGVAQLLYRRLARRLLRCDYSELARGGGEGGDGARERGLARLRREWGGEHAASPTREAQEPESTVRSS